jgi:hypothetical protein
LRFALDAEALLRALMAWSRGERRVCSMVRPPSPEAEDARRPGRDKWPHADGSGRARAWLTLELQLP